MSWPNGWFWSARRLAQRCQSTGRVSLTFDDGPGRALTPQVLDLLGEAGVQATFFMLGRNAAPNTDLVERIVAEGHEPACHTHDHLNAWTSWPWRIATDIDRGYRTLSRWVPPDGVFRPPYGKVTPMSAWQLWRRGSPVVMWSHDSGDTRRELCESPDAVADRVLEDGGGVVLLHDFDRTQEREERQRYVLGVTERLLNGARSRGLTITPVGALLEGSSR